MSAIELIQKELSLRQEANNLLDSMNIITEISRYGSVDIGGAYEYKLMVEPDIDLHLEVPQLDRNNHVSLRKEIGAAILDASEVHKVKIVDFVWTPPPPGKLRGLWFGITAMHHAREWSLDLWVTTSEERQAPQILQLSPHVRKKLRYLSDGERAIILTLKHSIYQDYPHLYRSAAVYEAVLEHGIEDLDNLLDYLEKREGARRGK